MTANVCPFVFWSQTKETLHFKVDLRDAKDLELDIIPERLDFKCFGQGSTGKQLYSFDINLYQAVLSNSLKSQIHDHRIDIQVNKEEPGWWPYPTRGKVKLPWLRVDFDRWCTESDDEAEAPDIISDYPDIYDKLLEDENSGIKSRRIDNFRESYLIMYNLWQLLGFSVILGKLCILYAYTGEAALSAAYETVGQNMKFAQGLQVLEILHPFTGITHGSAFPPLVQILGRGILLFTVLDSEPRLYDKPAVFYLFIVWSLAEIIRAPYYITKLVKREIKFLTWLRYSLWIVLYPLGFICEGVLYLRALPYYEETGKFSVKFPWINFSFHFPTILQFYLLVFVPGIVIVTHHMHKQRKKVLGTSSKKPRKEKIK